MGWDPGLKPAGPSGHTGTPAGTASTLRLGEEGAAVRVASDEGERWPPLPHLPPLSLQFGLESWKRDL